jgi:hypothetical protein
MAQKDFFPRINGRGEHVSFANMVINREMTTGNVLYMMALDMKNAFGQCHIINQKTISEDLTYATNRGNAHTQL